MQEGLLFETHQKQIRELKKKATKQLVIDDFERK